SFTLTSSMSNVPAPDQGRCAPATVEVIEIVSSSPQSAVLPLIWTIPALETPAPRSRSPPPILLYVPPPLTDTPPIADTVEAPWSKVPERTLTGPLTRTLPLSRAVAPTVLLTARFWNVYALMKLKAPEWNWTVLPGAVV